MSEALARYGALTAKVDAFFARVWARHGDRMRCAEGCESCCHVSLDVTGVEAAAVRAFLATLTGEEREVLRARARSAREGRCAALGDDGRCGVYAARPLVCRSHGVPVKTRDRRGLPVVSACELNFTEGGPAAADPDCVLDQETLSTVLAALEALHAREQSTPPSRVALRDLLSEAET